MSMVFARPSLLAVTTSIEFSVKPTTYGYKHTHTHARDACADQKGKESSEEMKLGTNKLFKSGNEIRSRGKKESS